jgi:hypothetical protein
VSPSVTSRSTSETSENVRSRTDASGSAAVRTAIGAASTQTSPSAFQYPSGARRREKSAVWSRSISPGMENHGATFPPSAYAATAVATIRNAIAVRSGARRRLDPSTRASATTSAYAAQRLSWTQLRSGATDQPMLTPDQAAKRTRRPRPASACTGARRWTRGEKSSPASVTSAVAQSTIWRPAPSSSEVAPSEKSAHATRLASATPSMAAPAGRAGAAGSGRSDTRALCRVADDRRPLPSGA